jgi:hypothetical protein
LTRERRWGTLVRAFKMKSVTLRLDSGVWHDVRSVAAKKGLHLGAVVRSRIEALVRADLVSKRFLYLVVLFSLARVSIARVAPAALNVSAQDASAQNASSQSGERNSGSWSGVLVSSSCNADEAFFESPECSKIVPGAKLALYDDTNRVMYDLEPQDKVVFHLGDTVTVRGKLDGDAIQIASIERMAIGLAVGQKAPSFSARDQKGTAQTLESLKGKNGTVLLFFRSADW